MPERRNVLDWVTTTLWVGAWFFPVVAAIIAASFDANWVVVFIITLIADLGLLTVICIARGIRKTERELRQLTTTVEDPANDWKLPRPELADAGLGVFFAAMGAILAIIPYALAYSQQPREAWEWCAFGASTLPMLGCFWVAYFHLRRYALTRTAWKLRQRSLQ